MVRSKFPGKPTKHSSRTRVNVLSGSANNNNLIGQQSQAYNNNIAGDATIIQDETVTCDDIATEDRTAHPTGARSDLMRVRLTRASLYARNVGEKTLAANVTLQCKDRAKRAAATVFVKGRRLKVVSSAAVESKAVGKFVLPTRSVHSSRVIKPNKRFITVDSTELRSYKTRVITKRQCIIKSGLKSQTKGPKPINDSDTETEPNQSTVKEVTMTKKAAKSNGREEARGSGMTTRNRVVLRQARLKIKSISGTSAATAKGGPFSSGNKPGTIICGVCGIPRFFTKVTFLQTDRFNMYSCEACSKFIVAMSQQHAPPEVSCRRGDGKCYEGHGAPSGRSMRNSGAQNPLQRLYRSRVKVRCRACWLKICLRSFQIPMALRASLMKMLPAHMQERNVFGGTVSLPAHFLSCWYASAKQSTSSRTDSSAAEASSVSTSHTNATSESSCYSTWVALSSSTPKRDQTNTCFDTRAQHTKAKALPPQPQRQRYHRLARDKNLSPANNLPSLTSPEAASATTAASPNTAPLIPLMDAAVKRQKMDLKGPRVKHVCRSASIVLGHSVATFPSKANSPIAGAISQVPVAVGPTEAEPAETVRTDDRQVAVCETVGADVVQTLPVDIDEQSMNGVLPLPQSLESIPSTTTISAITDEQQPQTLIANIVASYNIPNDSSPKSILDHDQLISIDKFDPPVSVSIRSEHVEVPISTIVPITKKEKKANISSQMDVQYFAPTRKPNTNVPMKPKNVLSIDFWESYDFEEVCRNGFSLTGSAPFPVQAICFLCGSAGIETLLHCCLCCEPYHPYCLEQTPPLFRQPTDRFSWLCPRCTTCTACGHADRQKINCQKCHNTYHPQCFNTKWRTDDRPTVCSNCLRCKSCGTDNITKFVGNLALCLLCFKLRNKGNFCPLCQRCYDDNDFDTKMMECGKCNKWVHSKCEGLSDEQYQILSILPESVEYLCCLCSTEATPYWRKAIQAELKNSFNTILCLLNKNQIARPMLKITPIKTTSVNICTPKLPPTSYNVAKRILFSDEKMCDTTIDEVLDMSSPACAAIANKRNSSSSDSSIAAFDVPSTPNIADIKRKINCNEYFSLRDFNNGMENALHANCSQSRQLLDIYHDVLRKVFPWFDPAIEESPSIDMSFADVSKLDINLLERDKNFDAKSYAVPIESEIPIIETRSCSLCKGMGDAHPQKEARLLYCGHNEWVHGNCALWSSEVYEEIDGSLQNVHGAINRGKSIKCTLCKLKGASVGCCQKGCFESYHFICAQKSKCQFMADKSIYCKHHDTSDLNASLNVDFDIRRSIYVELDTRKKKYIESFKINYVVGSLSVLNLGLISASVSDTVDAIIPTSFVCSRLFWSTKSPWQLVPYVIKTSVLKGTSKTLPIDKNFTVDHSQPKQTVDRKLKELSSWLRDEKDVLPLAEFYDEEEPQNTADILSPELTDAILQELPHGLLDGLMSMDFKNSEINCNYLNGKAVSTDMLDMDIKRTTSMQPLQQQQRSCSLRLSCKLNSPAMKKRKTLPAPPPPRENVYLHLLVDGPCDSSSGSECGSPEPVVMFDDDDDDEEEEEFKRELAGIVEQPVTCDKCNCTYRTHASYARHLDNCSDPIFTSESDSEEQNHHMIICPATVQPALLDNATVVLNVEKKPIMPSILSNTYETYSFIPQSDSTTLEYINQQAGTSLDLMPKLLSTDTNLQTTAYQSPQKSVMTLSQPPTQGLSFSIAASQTQQPTTAFMVSSNTDESQFALPLNTFNLSLNQLPLTLQSLPSAYSAGHQDIMLQTSQPTNMNQITIDAKLINLNDHNQGAWGVKSYKSPRAQYVTTRKAQASPAQQTLLVQQPASCPTQVIIQSLPTNGQLVTVPTFVDSNGGFVSTGNQMQYVTANSAPHAAPTLLQLHQATADGNFINLVPNIQMQPQSTPVYSIQPPTTRLDGGQIVVDNNGSMLWATSAPSMPGPVSQSAATSSQQAAAQPLFYGFETIVQNTVMQSQQFLPTTMPGVLSSNSSYSTTTQNSFQVFQTSKLEPVLDMSHGGFVFVNNNTPSTPTQNAILNSATYTPRATSLDAPQTLLTTPPQLSQPIVTSYITPPQQTVSFAEALQQPVAQQQNNSHQQLQIQQPPPQSALLRTIKTEPFDSFESCEQRPTQQLLLTKISRQNQQQLQLQQQQQSQQTMVELNVPSSQDFCNKIQMIPEVKPIVSRTSTTPITYSPKSTIKHRPISRVLPMPTNPVKKMDSGPQQYRSKTVKKTPTNIAVAQAFKSNTLAENISDNVREVIKQNEEIARVKQEIIRAKEEIIKAKQEIVKTKEIIIPLNVIPQEIFNFSEEQLLNPSTAKESISEEILMGTVSTLTMVSVPSPQLLDPPILSPLELTKIELSSPKECLLEDVRKAAQNTFPPVKPFASPTESKEQEQKSVVHSLPPQPAMSNSISADVNITQSMEAAISSLSSPINQSTSIRHPLDAELDMPPINLLSISSNLTILTNPAILNTVDVVKETINSVPTVNCVPSDPEPRTQSERPNKQLPAHPLILNGLSIGEAQKVIENSEPSILYTIETHDGFKHSSTSIYELWAKVFEAVQMARQVHNMPPLPMTSLDMISNIQLLGLKTNGLRYLVEQMPGAKKCSKYRPMFNVQLISKDDRSVAGSPEHKKGSVRMLPYHGERKPYDMFGWLTSKHRRPEFMEETPRKNFSTSLSMSARYRQLKETCKLAVGVYPSEIHGRGLFAKIVIESGDMVIEYAGEVIRSILTDKRERYYNSKGIGCYMFRIDEDLVVDSTMKGNSARFINHSCDPNCYSKVVELHGHKHIIIFALRRILCGEELTYDYKFPIEDDKIPCTCGTKRCRKFLN